MRYPPRTVILLVAPWCAPCYGELAQLDEIAVAAKPHDLRVLLVDDGPRARAMMSRVSASDRWEPIGEEGRKLRAQLMGLTQGLPFSVITDGEGRICAHQKGGLNPGRVRAMVERCEAATMGRTKLN